MSRKIKFRAWNPSGDMTEPFRLGDPLTNIGYITEKKWPIMQFTGIKDDDGNDVYEGDIIEYEFTPLEKQVGEFIFDNSKACFCIKGTNGFRPYKFRVIGNIYKNKELLK